MSKLSLKFLQWNGLSSLRYEIMEEGHKGAAKCLELEKSAVEKQINKNKCFCS